MLQPDLQAAGAERLAGATLYPTAQLPEGVALVGDTSQIVVGVRRDIDVAFSGDAKFTSDSVAARSRHASIGASTTRAASSCSTPRSGPDGDRGAVDRRGGPAPLRVTAADVDAMTDTDVRLALRKLNVATTDLDTDARRERLKAWPTIEDLDAMATAWTPCNDGVRPSCECSKCRRSRRATPDRLARSQHDADPMCPQHQPGLSLCR